MKLNINGPSRVVFTVKSYDQCRAFYDKVLKFPIDTEWNRGHGDRGVVYVVGSAHLELLEGDHSPVNNDVYLYIPVRDIDALWVGLKDHAQVVAPIATQPWGHRNFMIRDPAGIRLKFYSEVGK